jgi:cyclopropane-fatty-acyl-phospholipid synthase
MNTAAHSTSLNVKAARGQASVWRKPLQALLRHMLASIHVGSLHVHTPEGDTLSSPGSQAGPQATLTLHNWKPVWKISTGGDIGLAESFHDGDWSSPDLVALLQLGLANEATCKTHMDAGWLMRWLNRLQHWRNDNSRTGSRRNISFHYDLGNDFYRHWLDADLIYSSGIYAHAEESLESAQARKLQRITELVGVAHSGAPSHILEIGCGWGALACQLAQSLQASVTGITLSKEQLRHAQQRAADAGLSGQVQLQLQDYRDVAQTYDHIVSIEMIEAVGERHWPTYFGQIRRSLRPGGRAVIQAITMAEPDFEHYRTNADFIQKYIFPGGMLLSPSVIEQQSKQAGLKVAHAETFGMGYAHTLKEWRKRFNQAWPQIAPLGFDEGFRRMWEYYLCYCEAGFRHGKVDVGLYVLEHAGD